MMRLLVLVLFGCAGSQPTRLPADPPPQLAVEPPAIPAAAPATPTTAQPLSEAQLIERTHAWLDAWDRFDAAQWSEPIGESFVMLEHARFFTKELIASRLKAGAEKQMPRHTREWDKPRTVINEATAIFISFSTDHRPASASRPAVTSEGFHTVVWSLEKNRWVVSHWQWQRADAATERDRWNEVYVQGGNFNKQPNQLLVDTIKARKPGSALDLGMGQGRNALHLASQGWKTTGVDVATEGLRIAREEAAKRKLKNLTALEQDMQKYDFGTAKWDLITMIYEGTDHKLVERIQKALKPGGLFISEYFHAESEIAKTGAGGWQTGELAQLFADTKQWKILRDDVVEDVADWSMRKTKLVRFVAQKL